MTWTDPQIGIEIGGFRLEAVIGRGGMGTVYRASQLRLNRPVALKILPPSPSAKARRRLDRFLREAHIAASLNHPNIVQIYDAGEHEGLFFIAMELVEGRTLHEIVAKEGPIPEAEAVPLFIQCAGALEGALEKNLIHRDIKPENIMITAKGTAKVADFGLARDLTSDARITAPGSVLGTPAFMSPEQGMGIDVDHRSDLYSLGATMFFALCARFPFHSKNPAELIRQHIKDPIPDPRSFNPAVSDAFVLIIRRLMAKKPEDRYQNVTNLIEDLEHLAPASRSPLPSAPSSVRGDTRLPSAGARSPEHEPVHLSSPIDAPLPRGGETLEVPSDSFRVLHRDPNRFVLETADGFEERPPTAGHSLAEVESKGFQIVPGLARAPGLESALLAFRGTQPLQKVFLFFREHLRLGRQASVKDPEEGPVRVDILLRALPCRSAEEDPENYRKNLTISRYHAALVLEENQIVLHNRKKNQGMIVDGKPVPPGRPLRLSEESSILVSRNALKLDVKVYPVADSGRLFRLLGEPPPDREALLGMGSRCRIDCVRITRPENACAHSYVLLARTAGLGQGDDEAIRIPDSGSGTRLYLYRGELFVGPSEGGVPVSVDGRAVKPGNLAPLSPGAVLRTGDVELEYRIPQENDFKTL